MEESLETPLIVAILGLLGVVTATGATLGGKYFLEYKLAARRLQVEERDKVSLLLNPALPNFLRAARDLYIRCESFFSDPGRTSLWLRPHPTPREDGYYLREFTWRLFNFIALGRIVQNSINALPLSVTEDRPDLQRTFGFVDLSLALLSYTWLFKGIDDYNDQSENLHLFSGTLDRIAEYGLALSGQSGNGPSRADFDHAYDEGSDESPLRSLRDFLSLVSSEEPAATSIIVSRIAALGAALASYLRDYSWNLKLPDEQSIQANLIARLDYASGLNEDKNSLVELVPPNLKELMDHFQCQLLCIT